MHRIYLEPRNATKQASIRQDIFAPDSQLHKVIESIESISGNFVVVVPVYIAESNQNFPFTIALLKSFPCTFRTVHNPSAPRRDTGSC